MKTLAFVIGLLIAAFGTVGILAPAGLIWVTHHAVSPAQLYFIAVVRVAFGVLLISVASGSRASKTLRVVALIPLVAGISTPFVGVDRAPAILEWWTKQGSAVIRLTALAVLALGGFVAYACAPAGLSDFTRWLYRGQRPNWIARILNRATAAVGSSGVASNYLVTLEVTGRKSGRTVSLPVVLAVVDGQQYLVSMLGDNVQWVHNVRASGGRAVLRSGAREEIQLEEVPAGQRAPILRAYLQRAPGARPHVPVNKDAALAEFQKIAAAFPVFRLVSRKRAAP